MTRDEVAALFARRHEAHARRDAIEAAQFHAEDSVVESPLAGGAVAGREAIEKTYRTFFAAFPDLKTETDDLLIDGNDVAWFFTHSGTDLGNFMGLPPTGKTFRARVVFLSELRDGKIVRELRIYDFTGVLVQIGLLKTKPV
jgi:steroid delta-isomerase-like uncharacterized protein